MNKKRWLQLIAGVVIFVIFLRWINLADSLFVIFQTNWFIFAVAMGMAVVTQFIRSLRFYYLSKGTGVSLNLKKIILTQFMTSLAGVVTPGRVGEGGKIFFFDNKKTLTFSFLTEKIGDFSLQFIVGLLAIFTFQVYGDLFVFILALFIIGIISLLKIDRLLNFILRRQEFEKGWFTNLFKKLSRKTLLIFIFFTVLIWFNINLSVWVYSISLGFSLSLLLLLQIFTIANLIGAISGTPGGVGSTQIIFTFLLVTFLSLTQTNAAALTLIVMIGGYIIYTVLTLISYAFYKMVYSKEKKA
ncbi:MAG: lysylphosphatidylglycerol synthase transmembrane domain-containing protein [Nanoarchaeota archaeon]